MGDLYVYSNNRAKHIEHLRLIFEKCRVYKIFLSLVSAFLWFSMVNLWVTMCPKFFEKFKVIAKLPSPRNGKELQIFMGHRNGKDFQVLKMARNFKYLWIIVDTIENSSTFMFLLLYHSMA